MQKHFRAVHIAAWSIGYLTLAALWLIFSDRILPVIPAPDQSVIKYATPKVFVFALITIALFSIALTSTPPAKRTVQSISSARAADRPWVLVVVLMLLTIIVSGISIFTYSVQRESVQRLALNGLNRVAALKADDIHDWLQERFANIHLFTQRNQSSSGAGKSLHVAGGDSDANLLRRMESYAAAYGFASIAIINKDGTTLLRAGQHDVETDGLPGANAGLASAVRPGIIPPYRDAHGRLLAGFYAPFESGNDAIQGTPANVVFIVDLERTILSHLNGKPITSATGEAILVQRFENRLEPIVATRTKVLYPFYLPQTAQPDALTGIARVFPAASGEDGLNDGTPSVLAVTHPTALAGAACEERR